MSDINDKIKTMQKLYTAPITIIVELKESDMLTTSPDTPDETSLQVCNEEQVLDGYSLGGNWQSDMWDEED